MADMNKLSELVVIIRGGGEVASGVAYRLHLSHLRVCLTEVAAPVAVTRGTTFSEAVFDGVKEIMGVTAELVPAGEAEIDRVWKQGNIPIVVDPEALIRETINPDRLVDAIMTKRNMGTTIDDAPLVIGVGPGFYAGRDVHSVVESNHSENLGRVIADGEAEKDTGIPVLIGGMGRERIIWAPRAGIFTSKKEIGDSVVAGEVIAYIDDYPLPAPMNGVLRGLIRNGINVRKGGKLIEVDPVHDSTICNLITRKVMTIGEGVFQAIQLKYNGNRQS